jgi:hypothetical protein
MFLKYNLALTISKEWEVECPIVEIFLAMPPPHAWLIADYLSSCFSLLLPES